MLRQNDEQTDLLYSIRGLLRWIMAFLVFLILVTIGWDSGLHSQMAELIRLAGGR